MRPALLALVTLPLTLAAAQRPGLPVIIVGAGDFDREDTVVTVKLPGVPSRPCQALSYGQGFVSLQVANGEGSFIVSGLKKGETRRYNQAKRIVHYSSGCGMITRIPPPSR